MAVIYSYNIRASCDKLLEDLELALTPFTIIIGAPQRGKATLLKSLYFAITAYARRQPDHVFATLFPGLHKAKLNVEINDYYVEFNGQNIVKMRGEPPWKYTVYIVPDHPTIVRMMLEAAEFIERFKHQHAAITMLGGLASILATIVDRYGKHTCLSRLALCACDVFIQAGLDEMCKSWRRALNSVLLGLGARALASVVGLNLADITLSDCDIYRKFIEALLAKSKNNTIILVENMNYCISLKKIQELIGLRISRADNIAVIASISLPPGIAKSLESGEMSRSRFIDGFQAVFEVDLDPSISSIYLFKKLRGEDKIMAERLFP